MKKVKFLASFFVIVMLFGVFAESTFAYSQVSTYLPDLYESSINRIQEVLSESVEFNEERIIVTKNKGQIISSLDQEDIDNLNKLSELQGIKQDKALTKASIVDTYLENIEYLNGEVADGNLEVLSNGALIDADDDHFYVQGGVTKDQTFWWGKRRYKSTASAKRWVRDLKSAGHANVASSLLAGAVFGGVGAIPNGLTAVYAYNLADKIEYRNSLNNRGVIVDIHWTLTFKTKSQ